MGLVAGIKADGTTFKSLKDKALLKNDKGEVLQNKLNDMQVGYADWFATETEATYTAGLKALTTAMGAYSGLTLSENTNFGECNYECYPKTEEEMAVLELVEALEKQAESARFLAE